MQKVGYNWSWKVLFFDRIKRVIGWMASISTIECKDDKHSHMIPVVSLMAFENR